MSGWRPAPAGCDRPAELTRARSQGPPRCGPERPAALTLQGLGGRDRVRAPLSLRPWAAERAGRAEPSGLEEAPGLGTPEERGAGAGGLPPALPSPTGAENVICCAFQARFPGVTSRSRQGGGADKEARRAERGPRRQAGGCGGGGDSESSGRRRLANGEAPPGAVGI